MTKPPAPDEVLARIGPRTITVQDYLERIDLMPFPGKDNPGQRDSVKIHALASLVAEKLMSIQAVDRGFIENRNTSTAINSIEQLLARDELYRREVKGKVNVSAEESQMALRRYASLLRVNTYRMSSEETAVRLAKALDGRSDTAVAVSNEGVLSHDTLTVGFGDLTWVYEEAVYDLDSLHQARAVVDPDVGWSVFQLVAKWSNPAYVNANMQARQIAAEQKLKKRKKRMKEQEFSEKFFTRKLQMDPEAFRQVAESLFVIMLKDSAGHRQQGFFGIRGDDIDQLRQSLASHLATPFVTMGKNTVTTGEIIEELRFFPLRFEALRKGAFLYTLNQTIQPVAEAAILSREAKSRRLNETPDVRRELSIWGDAMQADKLLKYLLDSLGRAYAGQGARDSLSREAAESKAAVTINKYLVSLAGKYNIEMDFKKLKEVQITPSNMVTRRFIGFGGSMMAMPMLMHLWEWLDGWKNRKEISP